ncbi:acyltransferase [Desulfoluna spongiiphila]|uniref:acyltransferase n=1 Tax=Desulfoluna spongiiphila TaxID=419481 RepID=UPI0012572BAE|nr:acyltransferase [Desulfoluna spongiiphila]VVS91328.1 hexapeptide repeat [Desulfoluna spongiiphila]
MNLIEKIRLKFFIPSGFPYARYLKDKGFLRRQGTGCFIAKNAGMPDGYLTAIGDNVWITDGCQLLCHDASVIMLNIRDASHLDRVAPITIGDHVFLGNRTTILPGITLGSHVIVGAGSVVTRDIPDGEVWAGNPARHICTTQSYRDRLDEATGDLPWYPLLEGAGRHVFDPHLETKLRKARIAHFFSEEETSP